MIVRLVLWNLADSKSTIEELRRYLRDESVDAFEDVEGLRFKAWLVGPGGRALGRGLPLRVRRRRAPGAAEPRARPDREGARPHRGVRRRGDDRGPLRGRGAVATRARVRVAAPRELVLFQHKLTCNGFASKLAPGRHTCTGTLERCASRSRRRNAGSASSCSRSTGTMCPWPKRGDSWAMPLPISVCGGPAITSCVRLPARVARHAGLARSGSEPSWPRSRRSSRLGSATCTSQPNAHKRLAAPKRLC